MAIKISKKSPFERDEALTHETASPERQVDLESGEKLPPKETEVQPKEAELKPTETEKPSKSVPQAQPQVKKDTQTSQKSETLVKIEDILEDDLDDAFSGMDEKKQEKFKIQGEKTAQKIESLFGKTRDVSKKVFKLIFKWLKVIPGVNKFFIKQEAKIKTEKIMGIKDKK